MRGWLYRDIIFSLLAIFGEGVIISWHHIFTPDSIGEGVIISWHYIFTLGNIWCEGDYIVTLYFHSWQYLVRGLLFRDIFSPLKISGEGVIISWHIFTPDNIGEGVIISWHYIFTPDNIWWGDDYIVTLYSHPWKYLVRGDYIVTYFHSW